MDFSFSLENEDFRSQLISFLDESLPEDWNNLGNGSPYSPVNLEFTQAMSTVLAKQEERIKASLQEQEIKIQEMIKSSGKTDPSQTKTDQPK